MKIEGQTEPSNVITKEPLSGVAIRDKDKDGNN